MTSDSRPASELKGHNTAEKKRNLPHDLENILDEMSILGGSVMDETNPSHIDQHPQ